MISLVKTSCLLLVLFLLLSCDQVLNKAGSEYLKTGLKDACGEDDTACVAAVDNQFQPCQKKYEKEWYLYMNSDASNENERLEIYTKKLYSCIVDNDGEPYFYFDKESI